MNNIWTIFKKDLKHLGINAIAWVVVVGLIVIPSLYAWFCIYAFWDPYNHTENLQVAVANSDEGYEGSLIPVRVNLGKEVLEELRDNKQMSWVFLDEEEAVEGVRSGKYYAALVIPESFSRDLLSILSEDVQPAQISFYINEKENAVAAKVTNQGADAVQQTIDQVFAETTSSIALNTLEMISGVMSEQDAAALSDNLKAKLEDMSFRLSSAADTMDQLCSMNSTLNSLLKATDSLLKDIGDNTYNAVSGIQSPDKALKDADNELDALVDKIDRVFADTQQAYQAIDQNAADYLDAMNTDAGTVSASLNTFADQADRIIGEYGNFRDDVQALSDTLPSEMNTTRGLLNDLAVSLDRSIRQQTQIRDGLREASAGMSDVSADAVQYRKDLHLKIDESGRNIKALRNRFRKEVRPEMQELSDSLTQTVQSVRKVTDGLQDTASDMKSTADAASGQLEDMNTTLQQTRDLLRDASAKTGQLLEQSSADSGSAGAILRNLMNNNPDTVGSYFSSVVQLDEHVIYPVANFGTAMTPFYTCLAIWVGAVILVAMLKVRVSDAILTALNRPKNRELYLGRFGVFLLLALAQSLLVAVGDLLFLGVKCVHPVLFVLTCLYISFVFVTVIYTLAASFGNIGKAIAVILLVFQVAGSGGTIPIEMTPPFFHVFYPMLPLTHAMNVLRECVTGLYGHDLLREMGILGIYVLMSLLLGLVLRNPVIGLNEKFEEKMESTKVM
ncbi:MAG: YhgE/Pip domain-containing protein [Firmicutes bacterium]|nr:YhgE/Pip domain-containing protein [Bacillota bacterium]